MRKLSVFFSCIMTCVLMSACDSGDNYAPVTDLTAIEPIPRSGAHMVKHGETLYEISWRYGLDYRTVAARNHITASRPLHSGERLVLNDNTPITITKIDKRAVTNAAVESEKELNVKLAQWVWPTKGYVIDSYSAKNKGVNIAAHLAAPIYAAAPGKVVYSGNGLRGYGNLIILKHNNLFLSAYAHNRRVFVKEGDWIKQGQKIAEMGNTGTDRVMLHFEIRRAGKPVDPAMVIHQPLSD